MEIRRRPPNPSIKVASLEYAIPHSESEPRNILEKIVWEKDREVELSKKDMPLEDLKSKIKCLPQTKDFLDALKRTWKSPAVIAEIKKASPSKGVIREKFDPVSIAKAYEIGGASCLSVLTDKSFFQGGFEVLLKVRDSIDLPILCKDFIVSAYQIFKARAFGADAILLIASILSDQDLVYLQKIAKSLDLEVLVEVHNSKEMERVINLGIFSLIGINNRDLKTFEVDLQYTENIIEEFNTQIEEKGILLVSESGLHNQSDLKRVYKAGAKAVLVGEALMREENITEALVNLIGK